MGKQKKSSWGSTIFILILLIVVFGFIYPKFSFGYFMKSIRENDSASFSRDSHVKYSDEASYKIVSENYADALFYQTIDVIPNTTYKVSCMVKTEDVENFGGSKSGGAQISIAGTTERSEAVYGTTDWTKIELFFNSKNREQVDIAFRLGGYNDESKGTAYFSDFETYLGVPDYDNSWHFGCFVFETMNASYYDSEGKMKIENVSMNQRNREDVYDDMRRLQATMKELSRGKMEITYDIITIKEPISSLTYDEENGYYIDVLNVIDSIDTYLKNAEYDHIYLVSPFGNINVDRQTGTSEWVGLGGMDYNGIGFSNIRLSQAQNDYTLRYDTRINIFPEEVFLHEFLHTLERNAAEYGYEVPALHDYGKYGYQDEELVGLKKWYASYMQGTIRTTNEKMTGLPEQIYESKPVHKSNFTSEVKLGSIRLTTNIFEEILSIIDRTKNIFNQMKHEEVDSVIIGVK